VSLYRVHFSWRGKDVQLTAKSLDLTHPYFVSIRDIFFDKDQKLIINPSEEDVRRAFGGADHLLIPFQTVSLIEEYPESAAKRIRSFTLIADAAGDQDGSDGDDGPDPQDDSSQPVDFEPSASD
jgi:hypothetical protein